MNLFKRKIFIGLLAILFSQVFFSCTTSYLSSACKNFPANNELAIAQFNNTQTDNTNHVESIESNNSVSLASAEKLPALTKSSTFSQPVNIVKSLNKRALKTANISPKQLKDKALSDNGKAPSQSKTKTKDRNQWIALILAVLLGAYGAHRFYLGHTKTAVLQLMLIVLAILAFLAAFIFIPLEMPVLFIALYVVGFLLLIVNFVWVIVDIVNILTGDLQPKDGEYSETIDF